MLVLFISVYKVFFFFFLFFWYKFYNSIVDNYILNDKKVKQRKIVERLELNFQCLEVKKICLISGIANKNFWIYCVLHEICLVLSN